MIDLLYNVERELKRRNYSEKTIKSYVYCIKKFLEWVKKDNPRKITKHDIKEFLYYHAEKNKSSSTLNLYLQALKFALEKILNKRFFAELPFSKKAKSLPVVLSKEEVKKLIDSIENDKHKLMIRLMYSAGLRLNELICLKVKDIEFDNMYGWVRKGKGNKDRLFIIAESIKNELSDYIKTNNLPSESWLVTGRKGHISGRSVQNIVRINSKKAGILKSVHPHTLRHSFATHLIENGYDLTSVQTLMGHNSVETTMVYVHMKKPKMINVKSPLDGLED